MREQHEPSSQPYALQAHANSANVEVALNVETEVAGVIDVEHGATGGRPKRKHLTTGARAGRLEPQKDPTTIGANVFPHVARGAEREPLVRLSATDKPKVRRVTHFMRQHPSGSIDADDKEIPAERPRPESATQGAVRVVSEYRPRMAQLLHLAVDPIVELRFEDRLPLVRAKAALRGGDIHAIKYASSCSLARFW